MKHQRFLGWMVVLVALTAIGLVGCAVVNPTVAALEKAKEHAGEGRYAEAADLQVECTESDTGCNQLYLITGDACFRVAKTADAEGRKQEAVTRYRCAADRLEAGIAMTIDWPSPEVRARYFENLCESLRSWQDLEKGSAARQLSRRLLAASERFLVRHPGHPAPVYFAVSARFALASPDLFATPVPEDLCRRLQGMIHDLEKALPEARATRYEQNYQRLLTDLNGVKRAVAECR